MMSRDFIAATFVFISTCWVSFVSAPAFAENMLTVRAEGANPSSSSGNFGGALDVQDRSLGINFDAFLKNSLYFGVSTLGVISGEGKACAQMTCFAVNVRGTAFGTNVGYRMGRFTPFVGVYRYDYETNIELPFGDFEVITENTDYRIGVWLDSDYGKYRLMASDLESDDASEVSLEVYYPISSKFSLLAGVFHWTGEANTNGLSLGVVRHF